MMQKPRFPFTIHLIALLALLIPFIVQSGASGQGRRKVLIMPDSNKEGGLKFRLSEGQPEDPSKPRTVPPPPETQPISDEAAANLLKRLPPIKVEGEDEKEFALRDRSLPAPRTGETIQGAFPPAGMGTGPEQVSTGPLEVLRFSPEGEVAIAPVLSVTFSQPMVAVTSVTDLAAGAVPVKLTPQPPGRWRWVGTKTLLFEPEKRFPMATTYKVEIPAGTKSATGGALAAAKSWTFSTPPLQIKSKYPENGPHTRNPLFFIEFDQRINQQNLLKFIQVADATRSFPLRLATPQEIEADQTVRQMKSAAIEGNWIAFRIDAPADTKLLAGGTSHTVTVRRGAPSAEGERVTNAVQTYSFRTYDALRLTAHRCGYEPRCEPGSPWTLEFNNPIDQQAFDPAQIKIDPAVPGVKIMNYGQVINIQGATRARTLYKVTIDAGLKDVFGQTLGTARTVQFNVGDASPNLAGSGEGLLVLDPYAEPRYSIFSMNHKQLKVSLYAVGIEQWPQFSDFMQRAYQYDRQNSAMPAMGRLVSSRVINVSSKPDGLDETAIDLKPALNNGLGHVIVSVEAVQPPVNQWERRSVHTWVQATNIGLDAFTDQTQLLGWATNLRDGKPMGDVEMSLVAVSQPKASLGTAKSDAGGLVKVTLPAGGSKKMLLARKGNDLAFLPENYGWWNENYSQWQKRPVTDALRWHVFDDRGLYRPGEEVHIKGWVRRIGFGPTGDVNGIPAGLTASYILRDSRGNQVLTGNAKLNALGGFDTTFKLPPTMNLGNGMLELSTSGVPGITNEASRHVHLVRVQEFRRPEYEVKASASEGPHFIGNHATVTLTASYYAGGGLAAAPVNWNVTATPTNYTPPNRGDYTFGKWVPWWFFGQSNDASTSQQYEAVTDAAGRHILRIDFDSVTPARPTTITAMAGVQDVNRQSVAGQTTLLVHPSEYYVGLRAKRLFVQKGEPLLVDSIVTDLDGKAIPNREIRMRAVLVDWAYEKGEWKERETNPQECIVRSGQDAVQCRFETKEGGRYRVSASVIDDRERRNESELTLWVAGGKQPPHRDLAQEKVELIPAQKEYVAGQTAEILVQAPFAPAEAVLTLRRDGLVSTERFTLASNSHTLKIPIRDGYAPNLHVQVDLVGAATRNDEEGRPQVNLPKRPAFAAGSINLSIPPAQQKLTVTATPKEKAIEPGMETMVDVELKDAAGKPVRGGEVTVIVVDEAVLALSNYQLADPLNTFYGQRGDNVSNHHLREKVELGRADKLIGQNAPGSDRARVLSGGRAVPLGATSDMVAPMAAARQTVQVMAGEKAESAKMAPPPPPPAPEPTPSESGEIRARLDFNALATFAAALPTDENGRASVKVKLPDNLTRYRVMAVAAAGEKQFGKGESAITARLPLMVRPSAPRFLNFGDKFELPVVVQNQTDAPMSVEVAVRGGNASFVASAGPSATKGLRVTVPANDRVEVRFPATTNKPGTARFQIAGAAGKFADAAEVSLPVWTPATTEAFATYGEVDAGAILQPVKAPSDAFSQFGGLELTTSSTQLQALTDAVLYLTNYPYDCAEQISSRILAIAALRDVLAAFDAKGLPKPEELLAAVDRDMKRLEGMQSYNGGFGFWRRDGETWPYISIHVAHAMQRAKEKNFAVPTEMQQRSLEYLRTIEQHIPGWYSIEARRTLIAYSLYVRNRMGDRDAAKARSLIDNAGGVDKLPLEALGWLLPVVQGEADSLAIRRVFNNRASETAGTAHFVTSYKDGAQVLLHSERRVDGIVLESLIGAEPKSDLIPKLVRGLLGHRKGGRWENTQENCFVLLALDRYFQVYEKATPNFVARAWLGDAVAGSYEFRGRTTERHQINIPMRYLMAQQGTQNLALSKEGTGRLYYRIGMNYAPTSLELKPYDAGFTVTRTYEAIDNAADVRRNEDGSWRIRAGAQVRVRLTMVSTSRRYHVALVDPLPAGLETLNPELAITGAIPQDPKDQTTGNWWWRWWQWFEHQNMRDERVEAFTSLLWEGVYNYSYVTRATTPGVFVVPPAKAEEMYHPEVFGRSGSDRVIVE